MIRFLFGFEQEDRGMRSLRSLGLGLCLLALFSVSTHAQRKTTHRTAAKQPAAPATTKLVPPLGVRAAREKVDIQLSNVNDFLTKLGPVAASLETAITDQKAGKLKPETSQGIDRAKARLVESVHGIGDALNKLESEFRTTATLQKYLPTLEGIADLAARSEDSTAAGQFVAAKDPLREVVKKLTDALAALPR
jgi:hypothetical protein